MRRIAGALLALALLVAASSAAPPRWAALDRAVADSGFDGVVVAGDAADPGYVHGDADATWRWASVTKQLTALIVLQEVEAGRLALDRPVTDWWPEWPQVFADQVTIRALLMHLSGLADPNEDAPDAPGGMPGFYRPPRGHGTMAYAATHYCAEHPRAKPGLVFHYDNCDYIVLGALLERETGRPFAQLVRERVGAPLGVTIGLFAPGTPAPHVRGVTRPGVPETIGDLGVYGAAGGAYGSPRALYAFDRALIGRRLLGAPLTAEMWRGDPRWGAAALGQWQYGVPLAGCAVTVSVVERRGQIGGVQLRNFILPDSGRALLLFTARGDFDLGEVWRGTGFAYRALSAVGCA